MRCCQVRVLPWQSMWKQASVSQEEERSGWPVMKLQHLRSLALWWVGAGTFALFISVLMCIFEIPVLLNGAEFEMNAILLSPDIDVWRLCVWERKTRFTVQMKRELLHLLTRKREGKGKARSSPVSGKWCTGKLKAKMINKSLSQMVHNFKYLFFPFPKLCVLLSEIKCFYSQFL